MPQLRFILPSGEAQVVEAKVGQSVMEAATGDLVRGIIGECGGACSCATCHVYVEETWFARLTPADDLEKAVLDAAVAPGPFSRLGCQIPITDALDGLTLIIPAGQL